MRTICINIVAALWFVGAHSSHAQQTDDAKTFAKAWLSKSCHVDDVSHDDSSSFARFRAELRPYFLAAVYRQLEGNELREEEAAFGRIYDENLKRLGEHKPAWVTPEIEARLRSTSRDVYIREQREALALSYKQRALEGLAVLDRLQ